MNAPMMLTECSGDVHAMTEAIQAIMGLMPPDTDLLFYRDGACQPVLEISYPDGATELVGLNAPARDRVIERASVPQTHAAWMPVDTALPVVLTDVLLWQVLEGFTDEEGNTLIRIGYLAVDGTFVDAYSSAIDGSDDELASITHWAPLPMDPIVVLSAKSTGVQP